MRKDATRSRVGPFATLLFMTLFGWPGHASAQQITLFVVDGGDSTPLDGTTVSLVTPSDWSVWSGASDESGRVEVSPPSPGEYYIVAERVGFEPYRSPLLEIPEEGTYSFEIPLDPVPVSVQRSSMLAERRAADLLAPYGLSIYTLGNRFADRDRIAAVNNPFHAGDVLRDLNIPSLSIDEAAAYQRASGGSPRLCVRLVGTRCALLVLEGTVISQQQARQLDPVEFQAIAVLDRREAVKAFGSTGSRGAVLIWLEREVH